MGKDEQSGLDVHKDNILEAFLSEYLHPEMTSGQQAVVDQASAELRLSIESLGLNLDSPAGYFTVMGGLIIGAMKMEVMIKNGMPPEVARTALLASYANMSPVRYE